MNIELIRVRPLQVAKPNNIEHLRLIGGQKIIKIRNIVFVHKNKTNYYK